MATNKGNISPIPTERFIVSSADIMEYLQKDCLGFNIGCDFTRWTGIDANHSYVRMRTVFRKQDIMAAIDQSDWADKVLAENSSGIMFKDTVIKAIEPFKYPAGIVNVRNNPEELQRLAEIGLYGERLDELILNRNFNYSRDTGYFRIYLRPERIITQMLEDPATNDIGGEMAIINVMGETSETIRWEVEVTRNTGFMGNSDISIEAIFNQNTQFYR